MPGQPSPIDMPDDFFRIRLVCVLLDTCGMCFDRGSQQRKLDNFLMFFQMYVLSKQPLPMDVEFMLSDSLEVRFAPSGDVECWSQDADDSNSRRR